MGLPNLLRKWNGLSPRVRGNLELQQVAVVCDRSIPACAGEPIRTDSALLNASGLSPRVRGNHFPARFWHH